MGTIGIRMPTPTKSRNTIERMTKSGFPFRTGGSSSIACLTPRQMGETTQHRYSYKCCVLARGQFLALPEMLKQQVTCGLFAQPSGFARSEKGLFLDTCGLGIAEAQQISAFKGLKRIIISK